MNGRSFSAADLKTLRRRWLAGDIVDDIAAALNRDPASISKKAHAIGLPKRDAGRKQSGFSAHRHGRNAPPVGSHASAMKIETGSQAETWIRAMTDIRFDDDPRARRQEPMLRGRPTDNRSATGCAAAMVVAAG